MSFCGFLKADTQQVVTIGPFVDVGDGFTPETGITLGAADEAELWKYNTTTGVDISGNTWAVLNTAIDGYYNLTLTTTDTNTEGMLRVVVQDDTVCLPVTCTFMVVNANVYDSFFAVAATDYLDVQLKACDANVITAAAINADAITNAKIADDAIAVENIKDAAITAAKLGGDCITSDKIADGAIGADQLGADAITSAKIADDAISSEHLNTGALTADAFAADAIVAATLATGAITADAFAADAIVAATFATDAISADALAADALAEINAEVDTALSDINLDHLCKTATAGADMTTEVADNTILSRIISNGDTSAFDPTTDGLQLIRDHIGDGTNLTEAGGDGDHLTAINLPNQTMDITGDITGNLSGSVGSVTGHTPQTADHTANIAAILTDTGTTLDGKVDDLLEALVYKQIITEASGNTEMFNSAGASLGTVAGAFTTDGTFTTRLKLVI